MKEHETTCAICTVAHEGKHQTSFKQHTYTSNTSARNAFENTEIHRLPAYREPARIRNPRIQATTNKSCSSQASITLALGSKAACMRSTYYSLHHGYLFSSWPCYQASKVCIVIIASNLCIEQGHQTFCLPFLKCFKLLHRKQKLCCCFLAQYKKPMRLMMPTALAHQRAGHGLRRYTMDSKLRNRSIRAAECFLRRMDYKVMDTWDQQDFYGVVAMDSGNELVFAQVLCKPVDAGGFLEGESVDRNELELLACDWLREQGPDFTNTRIRFDVVSMLLIDSNRALLRHQLNALGQW